MQSPSPLVLAHGDRRWALGGRPISIGRLTECDIILPGDKVTVELTPYDLTRGRIVFRAK